MARAIEHDENGNIILTQGIAFGPEPRKLSPTDLKKADILVWYSSGSSRRSSAIREFSGGPYSHVGIYVGDELSVDAGPAGVKLVRVDELMANFSYASVIRRGHLTAQEQEKVVTTARAFVDCGYAWFDVFTLPARRRFYFRRYSGRPLDLFAKLGRCLTALRRLLPPSRKNTFCSRLVVEAHASAGYFPSWLVDECVLTPNDLAVQTFLTHAGWLSNTKTPTWHPLDPYSPEYVGPRRWKFSLARIWRGTSTGGK